MTSNDAAPVPSGTLPTLAVEGLLFRDLDHDGAGAVRGLATAGREPGRGIWCPG